MITIRLYFQDHAPVLYSGAPSEVALQIANARLYPGFVSWDRVPDPRHA